MSLPFQVKDVYVATSHNRSKAQGRDSCFCSFLLWLLPITGGLWGVQDSPDPRDLVGVVSEKQKQIAAGGISRV